MTGVFPGDLEFVFLSRTLVALDKARQAGESTLWNRSEWDEERTHPSGLFGPRLGPHDHLSRDGRWVYFYPRPKTTVRFDASKVRP